MKAHSLTMTRRDFVAGALATTAAMASGCASAVARQHEVIDCHTHFYDPTRPQGVPWPGKNDTQLYRRVLPADYRRLAAPLGVTGTVVVEASAWIEDNQWLLDLAADEPFIKGFVGHLNPGDTEFPQQIKRFARNPLFRGIRVSGGAVNQLAATEKLGPLRLLAENDLSLDANGGVDSLAFVATVARTIPALRIIINHVANVRIDGGTPPQDWIDGMRDASAQPNVFCKVSGLVEGGGQRHGAPRDEHFYRPVLDYVWQCFGEDRLVYGSNWPVSELFADFATVHGIVKSFFTAQGERAAHKYFSGNARRFYKYRSR